MRHYRAQTAMAPAINRSLFDANRQIMIGAHRGIFFCGRRVITNYNVDNAKATANAIEAGMSVAVNHATLNNAGDFVVVSGLTYCIGVIVARATGGNFTQAVVAHFNGNYDNATAWGNIRAGVTGAAGPLYAIVISTSDTSTFGQQHSIVPAFSDHLHDDVGVPGANITFYHSHTSGVAFIVRRDGIMGEPQNHYDFPY